MPSFQIVQFGCRATQADAAAIEAQLLTRGCTVAHDGTTADVVVINTCTVTAAADAQARDAIRKISAKNPAARLIVTGCYAQRAPEELAGLPGVSWVVGNSHKTQIPNVVQSIFSNSASRNASNFVSLSSLSRSAETGAAKIITGDIFDQTFLVSTPVAGGEANHTRPTLKIQDGCNSRCSYCVIPFVRGKSRSLSPNTVIEEIQKMVSSGFREIILSGINLGSYGRDLSPRVEFAALILRILEETSLQRLRISSIEPMDVTKDLLDLFASSDRLAQHFHMPLQSGSDRILAAMHRWYRAEHYAQRVQLIREQFPNAAIGADVIAGFPGESSGDHAATLGFIKALPFTYLHVFSYSSRPGTKAAELSGHVDSAVIKDRARELRALAENKAAAFRVSQIGCTAKVLTLHRNEKEEEGFTPALSSNYLRIRIPGNYPANQWHEVQFVQGKENSLVGLPAKLARRASA
jgi:threonylcarbamoyladenosine tRNA methylthiotransferase MtaB